MASLPPRSRPAFTLIELLVVIAIIAVLMGLLVPAVQQVREAANRTTCVNNLKQFGIALHNYHDTKKCFPPGNSIDGGTKNAGAVSAYGWAIYLMPYLEQSTVYNQLNPKAVSFQTNLTTPAGLAILKTPLRIFICPSDTLDSVNDNRKFAGVTDAIALSNYPGNGGNTADSGIFSINGNKPGVRILEIRDGTSNTLAVGERCTTPAPGFGDCFAALWAGMDTAAITGVGAILGLTRYQMQTGEDGTTHVPQQAFSSRHPGGANHLLCDGSVTFINQGIDWAAGGLTANVYNKLGDKADGQPLGSLQ